ncbi:hypothetical protein BR93DRAFT_652336 [Coniochaeta sp. PMI_546]|nr:hypothetical protein BR93DRAFT_652336 [Coniochaeta sp. PMI_546]
MRTKAQEDRGRRLKQGFVKLDINHYFVARALFGPLHHAPFRRASLAVHFHSAGLRYRKRPWEDSASPVVKGGCLLTMTKPSVYRFVASVVEAARKTTRPRHRSHAPQLIRRCSLATLLAAQSFPVSLALQFCTVPCRFVASNGLFGGPVEDAKGPHSGMDCRR